MSLKLSRKAEEVKTFKLALANDGPQLYFQPMDINSQLEFIAFRSLLSGLRLLPYSMARQLLLGTGIITGKVLRIRRSVVRQQLEWIYPHENSPALESLTDSVYNHLALTVAEVFCGNTDDLISAVKVTPGWHHVDQARALGRGAIIATGHIGNFELGGACLARRYRLLDVVKNQRNVPFDQHIQGMRENLGIKTVPMQRCGLQVLKHLRSGGLVSLLLDQDAGNQGMKTSFLGRAASTWPGIARFSIRTGCPVIPMALIRLPDGGHELKISSPLEPGGLTDQSEDVRCFLEKISGAVEEFIWENPEQWFWVHRRWKSRKGED